MASRSIHTVMGSVDPYFQRHHKVTIPSLQCSQPKNLHPRFESIREETNSWLLSVTQPTTIEAVKHVVQTQIPFLVCSAYANAQDDRRCSAVAKFIAWTFMTDDMLDVRGDTAYSSSQEGNLDNVLPSNGETIDDKESLTSELKLGQSLDKAIDTKGMQWWKEINNIGMSSIMRRRFLKAMEVSMREQKEQTLWHEREHVPDIKTYVETRRKAGGVSVLLILNEWCAGLEIGENMESNALLQELNIAVNDHVCWVNDLLSLKWEYCNGDLKNLPTIVCNSLRQVSTGCPDEHFFQKSVDIVQHLICMRDHDFARLLHHAYSTPSLMAIPGMPLYLETLGNWMSGHLHWCYATSRYHGLDLCDPLPLDAPITFLLSPPPN